MLLESISCMSLSTSLDASTSEVSSASACEFGLLSNARILFFVPDGNLSTNGVYASQVGGLAKYCEKLGATTMIWDESCVECIDREEDGVRKKIWFYQVPGHFRRLSRQDVRLMTFKPTHIYVRTSACAIAAKELAKKTSAKLVYSMRGVDVAESLLERNLRAYIIAIWSWFCVRRAMRIADHVNAVSKTMAEWIVRKFGRQASVLPCCIAQIKGEVEEVMQKSQGKTIIYSGGLSAWQKIDVIIALMRRISEVDDSIRFRFLTKDLEMLRKKCETAGLDKSLWSAKSCNQSEVLEELAKADCGIILRDDTLVNQVASPIKVGEYLAAGLGVIASPFIGDVGKDLADKEYACMVDHNTSVEQIVRFVNNLTDSHRMDARKWVMEHLTYDGNRSVVLTMFS